MGNAKKMYRENGMSIVLDTSDVTCLLFGHKSGTRVKDPNGKKATLIGVASGKGCDSGSDVMWYQVDGKKYVEYHDASRDLEETGFEILKK